MRASFYLFIVSWLVAVGWWLGNPFAHIPFDTLLLLFINFIGISFLLPVTSHQPTATYLNYAFASSLFLTLVR
jgi:hypothetical protein